MGDTGIVIDGPMFLLAAGEPPSVKTFKVKGDAGTVVVPVFRTESAAGECILKLNDPDLYPVQPSTLAMFEKMVGKLRDEGVTHVSIDALHTNPAGHVPIAAFLTAIRLG